MLKSHYSPVYPRMIPYDKLQCTGMYVHVREECWSSTGAIRKLYVSYTWSYVIAYIREKDFEMFKKQAV